MAKADQTTDTTAEIEENSAQALKAKRAAAIREAMNRGYTSGNETRKVRSPAHAEFLARAGTIQLP